MDSLEFGFGRSSDAEVTDFLDSQMELRFPVAREYPAVFSREARGESLWVKSGGKLVSHVGIVVREFRHPRFTLSVGLIGSVVTAGEFRGRGLASSLVRQASDRLRERGCALAVLWSRTPEFYRPLGFYPAGLELELNFDSPWESWLSWANVTEGVLEDEVARLWRLYSEEGIGLRRSLDDFRRAMDIPNLRIFTVRGEEGIAAYAALNKGTDFTDVIHEWAGPVEQVAHIVGHLKQTEFRSKGLRVLAPAFRDVAVLETRCQRSSLDAMGHFKVLDRLVLHDHYRASGNLVAALPSSLPAQLPSLGTEEEFLGAVLGWGMEDRHEVSQKLPFFIWGLDSV